MRRSRGTDAAQKPLAGGLAQLRTSSDSDLVPRFVKDRSPRLGVGDRRSPRGPQSDPMNQKKLGTRIADLESQLGEAQVELKNLKGQLALAEVAKREALEKLERKVEKQELLKNVEIDEKQHDEEIQKLDAKDNKQNEDINDHLWETDVFEVPKCESQEEHVLQNDSSQKEAKALDETETTKLAEISEAMKISSQDLVLKDEEISCLKAMLVRKDTELKVILEENELIKKQLAVAKADISLAETKGNEMASKLTLLGEKLQASKAQTSILNENLQSVERGKAALEVEMKQLRVQTEQWRKAADAAAAVLAGDADMNSGRIAGRCGSMEKPFPGVLESPVGTNGGYVGSPGAGEDMGHGLGGGKRRGSGIKLFGDLWKKKGHQVNRANIPFM